MTPEELAAAASSSNGGAVGVSPDAVANNKPDYSNMSQDELFMASYVHEIDDKFYGQDRGLEQANLAMEIAGRREKFRN
jgi:hypothetical protein